MAKVLLIEDEALLRWSLQRMLSKAGYTVEAADSLAQAERSLAQTSPDLVLLDLALPDGHGLDFLEANAEQLRDAVVLVMTAVGTESDAARATRLGAAQLLTKPVDHETLERIIRNALQR